MLEAGDKLGAKDFILRFGRSEPMVAIHVGEPFAFSVKANVSWENGLASLRDKTPRPYQLSYEQWDNMLEVIEYNLNETPREWHGQVGAEDDAEHVEDQRISSRWCPVFYWEYAGGSAKFEWDMEHSFEA